MSAALKPYLARSIVLHAAALAAVVLLAGRGALKTAPVYMIDFVGGPSAALQSAGPPGEKAAGRPQPAAAKVPQQASPDAIRTRANRRAPVALPRPSLLRGGKETPEPALSGPPSPSLAGAPGAGPEQIAAGPGGAAGAGIATDLPSFPYPWFLSQVRQMLWQAWQTRLPRLDAEGVVSFSILRNGATTDLAVESSSGEPEFDRAALAAVQAAAPFPALPAGFKDPFLKIHLTLKSEEAWR